MAEGIVLAGGFSMRMQENKMHLEVLNKPLIMHTIESLLPFVNRIIVVTGHYNQEIRQLIKEDEKIRIVYNKDYEKGMFSSVLCGVKEVKEDFFIVPGDIPFINAGTYEALIKGTKPVRYPSYKGKEGHPLFISISLKDALLKESVDSNLRVFRNKQDREVIPVDDKNILKDIDTIKDYQELVKERKSL